MTTFNAEVLLVVEADSAEDADEFAEQVVAEARRLWSLKAKIVEASVESIAEKRRGGIGDPEYGLVVG